MITQDSIEALKSRLDIVDVVGSYIELKKSGANFKAPCPFHNEKTASFVVSPSKQIFHCFGCGIGGDSIKFVMEYEKLNYPEAIEKLAQNYNFTLSYDKNSNQKPKTQLIENIQKWYQSLLYKNQTALKYLKDRGVYDSSIEKFGIGYAPSSELTINYIKSNFFDMNEAIEMGVVGSNDGRVYARFIERITFPIYSANSTLVGFGGRTITNHQAKYVNSPETKFFNKSRLLYAYNLARQDIYKKKQIIITEGYLDVIMLHQAGFNNAVATLGTALTSEHLPLLRKGEPKVVMAYDADNAGKAAALKASKLLSLSGFDGGVVIFKDGLDPADMVKNGNIDELKDIFSTPIPFIEFVIDEILSHFNLNIPKEKEKALNETTSYLKSLSSILQEEYKTYISAKLGINPSFIKLNGYTINSNQIATNSYKDILELSFVKTILEKPHLADMILDLIDPSFLQFHQNEFILAMQNKKDRPELMRIMLDESIKSIENEEELKSELTLFLIKHYNKELKKIQMRKDISFEKKAFYIRSFRDKILELKRGELTKI